MRLYLYAIIFCVGSIVATAQDIYFPPKTGNSWKSISPESLGWDIQKIPELYAFLEEKNTKAFIVLKDGAIVLEQYFGTFSQDSNWYWASAGKTLTAMLVGIAQQEKILSLSDKTSLYLGNGWSAASPDKEEKVLLWHQLTMTSGFDDRTGDPHCTEPKCFQYIADAGTRWAYHNAPYTVLDKVVETATGKAYNFYFAEKIRNKIGMNGLWIKSGYNNVYFSTARSMARYGILLLNKGIWDRDTVLKDSEYYSAMISSSQDLNPSYGYLFWLNGKQSYMTPGLQVQFKGKLFPDAPDDVYAALGKDGQCLNVSPKHGLIIVRMGNSPFAESSETAADFSNDMWKYLQRIVNTPSSVGENSPVHPDFQIYPNPAVDCITALSTELSEQTTISIENIYGDVVVKNAAGTISVSQLPSGVYWATMLDRNNNIVARKNFIKY